MSRYASRASHDSTGVWVPADVRRALSLRYASHRKAAAALGVSACTAEALMSPGGVVRAEVLARVVVRLAE